MSQALVVMLNDQDSDNSNTLQREIDKLPGINKLRFKPIVECGEIGTEAAEYFEKLNLVPSFTFFDPFGYKGLSLRLINGVLKDWGCDCVFFFNYNRINAGISNPAVKDHMNALFGEERAAQLRTRVKGANPSLRQEMVLEELSKALKEMGGEFVLPFRFKNDKGRLTHHLIFVSKHFKGYEVMKEIMAKESSTTNQGVASFAYSIADASMPMLFELSRPLEDLKGMLLASFSGKQSSVVQIYRDHSVGTPFIKKNYKSVLLEMEKEGLITVTDPNGKARRRNTLADRLIISFPAGDA